MCCVYILLAVGEMEVKKVRSARGTNLQCEKDMQQGTTYRWTKDNVPVAANLGGINTDTLQNNILLITRMTQELVGIYRCFVDGSAVSHTTIQLFIVGRFVYIII